MPFLAYGQDVKHCIKVEMAIKPTTGERANSIVNTCDREVYLFWCHEGKGSGACAQKKYYQRARKMKPNERFFNKYSVPPDVAIHTGACLGRKKHVRFDTEGAGYQCKDTAANGQTNQNQAVIKCGNEQKSVGWRVLNQKTDTALIKLVYGDRTDTHTISSDELSALKKGDHTKLSDYVCAQKIEAADPYRTFRNDVIKKLETEAGKLGPDCAGPFRRDRRECEDVAPRNGGSGKRM